MLKFLERDRNVLRREGNVSLDALGGRATWYELEHSRRLFLLQVIKFDPNASPVPPISSVDQGVLEMSTTMVALQSQITELEAKIAE